MAKGTLPDHVSKYLAKRNVNVGRLAENVHNALGRLGPEEVKTLDKVAKSLDRASASEHVKAQIV